MIRMRVTLAALAALCLAAPALAAQVEIHGDFKNRLFWSNQADLTDIYSDPTVNYVNVTDTDIRTMSGLVNGLPLDTRRRDNDSDFFGEAKYRLWFDASDDEKKVRGVLAFEFGGSKYGESQMDFGGDDRNFLEVRWLYTDIEVPFDPASRFSMGLQPVGYNAYFWNDNAAGLKYSSKRDGLEYSLGWWRNGVTSIGGNNKDTTDDVYVLDLGYTFQPGTRIYAFGAFAEFGQDEIFTPDFSATLVDEALDKQLWLGMAAEAQAGNIFFGGTAIYLTGELDAGNQVFPGSTHTTLDRKAYLLNGEVTASLDKARLKAGWLYATGDDDPTDGDLENYKSLEAYLENIGTVVLSGYYADDNYMIGSNYFLDRGFNVPYLNFDYDATDKLALGAGYMYFTTTEDVIRDKNIGHEFNVRAEYQIAKGLSAGLAAGYLLGGDAWDELASDGTGDDMIRVETNVRFKF